MRTFTYLLLFVFLTTCNSSSSEDMEVSLTRKSNSSDCISGFLISKDKTIKVESTDSLNSGIDAIIKLTLIKLDELKVNPNLNWSRSNVELSEEREYINYQDSFAQMHNAILSLICIQKDRLGEEKLSEQERQGIQSSIDKYIDEYFDYLLGKNLIEVKEDNISENNNLNDSEYHIAKDDVENNSKFGTDNQEEKDTNNESNFSLTLRTIPPGGKIYVNNKFYGTSNKTLFLKKGKYEIKVTKSNFLTINDVIEIPHRKIAVYSFEK